MQKITTWLWFDTEADEAAQFYTSVFPDARITGVSHYGEAGPRPEGMVMTVSFELFEQGIAIGGAWAVGLGLGAGAIVYFVLSRLVERGGGGGGNALALGAFLDGIPEQTVLGIGLAAGEGVSIALLVAIFVSNLPEAIGSAVDMRQAGSSKRQIRRLWFTVAVLCGLATPVGYLLARGTGGHFQALINGFAAGALLVMLVDSMIPEATSKAGRVAGLATTLGFALAAGLSTLSA